MEPDYNKHHQVVYFPDGAIGSSVLFELVCDREVPFVQNVTGTHTIHCHVSADELMQKQQTH